MNGESDEPKVRMLSPTQVNAWFECPRRWYYRYFLRLKETKTWPLYQGIALHTIAEKIWDIPFESWHDFNDNAFDEAMKLAMLSLQDEGGYTPTDREMKEMTSLIRRLIQQLDWRIGDAGYGNFKRGLKYVRPKGSEKNYVHGDLRGIIDEVGPVGDLFRIEAVENDSYKLPEGILDYKTSKMLPDVGVREGYRRQLGIYSWIFYQNEGFWPDVATLYFIRDGSRVVYDDTEGLAEKAIDDVWQMKQTCGENSFYEPHVCWLCKFCDFKRMCDNELKHPIDG